MPVVIALRPVHDADEDALFEQSRDPESVRMAAFTRPDPDDRAAFEAHRARIRSRSDVIERAITVNGVLAGTIGCWVMAGDTEIAYWIDRAFWGRGIATVALTRFLAEVPHRPIFARAAGDNIASLRVLAKADFKIIKTQVAYAEARGTEIEESILRLDA
ncbi:GNAT family N-acetyltransferase [Actinoplanes couchii]|uniref:N-acetyltransferase n=1 Tax=Actinoplanes couchii TaxID=403638 RepID=A0ABQ3XFV2_9ACTN|nr:GNAT family N-acetyltransferase [Actinoplanes couchii]MDR6320874.1 RimJ/RimL family protein N-acetyltransferase [Actinoplanes couchii]GID57386.1 N-acetyltransferase [Actinoplanes couchii]